MLKIVRNFLVLTFAIVSFSFVTANAQNYSGGKSAPTIERQVFKQILKLPYYEVFDNISFRVSGDTVTLSGKVYNAINKSSAENVVKRIDGVNKVVNNIEVLPPSGFDNQIRRDLYQTFVNSGGLSRYFWEVNPAVRIIVDRGHVALEGVVSNQGDANRLRILANTVSNVFSVENNVIVDDGKAR